MRQREYSVMLEQLHSRTRHILCSVICEQMGDKIRRMQCVRGGCVDTLLRKHGHHVLTHHVA
ncbi:hypothetical protein WS95_04165 [Burkholderia sp. MSMB1826]|nr:hypothetical protein WS95_04165 [Burkholderia sp. MSMB1826]